MLMPKAKKNSSIQSLFVKRHVYIVAMRGLGACEGLSGEKVKLSLEARWPVSLAAGPSSSWGNGELHEKGPASPRVSGYFLNAYFSI